MCILEMLTRAAILVVSKRVEGRNYSAVML
jgi:hypothetical protein